MNPHTLGANVRAYIVDGNDASGEAVYFGSGGQAVEIVDDRARADIKIRVAKGPRSSRFLSAVEAKRRAQQGEFAGPVPAEKRRGAAFRYAVIGVIACLALGIVLLASGQIGGLLFILGSPVLGPITGWMLMGMLSIIGFR